MRVLTLLAAAAILCPAAAPNADIESWIHDVGGTSKRDKAGQIVEVDLTLTLVTDDDLAKLGRLPELRKIVLSHARISDLGLAQLRPLKKVTYLE
jgi:hypothetical protein